MRRGLSFPITLRPGRSTRSTLVSCSLLVLFSIGAFPTLTAAQSPGEVVEYYHLDVLGSVRVVTNQAGAVVRRHDFKPFGEEVNVTFPNPDRKLFTGQERDSETALDYFGARYYRAGIGRFTAVDPAAALDESAIEPQLWNRYAYVRNSPVTHVDPDGKFPVAIAAVIPGPQQPVVVAAVVIGAATAVVAASPGLRTALSDAWMSGVELLSDAMLAVRDRISSSESGPDERRGGGKTGRKFNEDRRASAERELDKAKQELAAARSVPNKTAEQAQKVRELEVKVKHLQKRVAEISEEHARQAQR